MKVIGLIPSRYGSTRLPAKALLEIDGLPLIVHTYKRAMLAKNLDDVIVCADNKKIIEAVEKHGGKAILTSTHHATGTDRIAEVAANLNAELFIDIQGDEPLISPYNIDKVIEFHKEHSEFEIILPTLEIDLPHSPHIVKVVHDNNKRVIYLSRATIPFPFSSNNKKSLKHLSIISFKPKTLQKFASLPKGNLEAIEGVELLRALENGIPIGTIPLEGDSFSVDVPDDYERAKEKIIYDQFRPQY